MTLTLRAVSLNDQPLTQPITAHFDAKGGTIGRADVSTLALPDPERHISRRQADILAVGEGYHIKNVGSANPILVRGQSLGQGESMLLTHRDTVRIGGYLLEVTDDAADSERATTVTQGRAAVGAREAAAQAPRAAGASTGAPVAPAPAPWGTSTGSSGGLAERGAPLSSSNPFADLMGDAAAAPNPFAAIVPVPVPVPARPLPPAATPAASRSSAPTAPPPPSADPFADLFGAPPPAAAGVPSASAAWSPPPAAPAARLPDDFDPFAPPPAAPPPRPAPAGGRAGAFEDLIPNAAPSSIDDLFNLGPGKSADPLADFMAAAAPRPAGAPASSERIGGQVLSTDPMALFGPAPAAPPGGPALADHTPELRAAFRPPDIVAPRSAAASPQAAPIIPVPAPVPAPVPVPVPVPIPAMAPSPVAPAYVPPPAVSRTPAAQIPDAGMPADTAALWAAFREGAGLQLNPPQGLNPELMRVIGMLLRTAVEGTLQLMAVRAATRVELHAAVTVIQSRNNNPLKFSPDAQLALEQMLQPPSRGFLPGPAAMTESMNDLVGHAIGTMAGTRAALEGVLDRFAPRELEAKLTAKSVLDSVLPMARKAKLWELYLQHFDTIRNDAQEDFQNLFGKAFLAAYEQQLERLRQDKKNLGD